MATIQIDTQKLVNALVAQLAQLGLESPSAPAANPTPRGPAPGTRESVDALTNQLASEIQTLIANKGINPNKDNTVLLVVDAR